MWRQNAAAGAGSREVPPAPSPISAHRPHSGAGKEITNGRARPYPNFPTVAHGLPLQDGLEHPGPEPRQGTAQATLPPNPAWLCSPSTPWQAVLSLAPAVGRGAHQTGSSHAHRNASRHGNNNSSSDQALSSQHKSLQRSAGQGTPRQGTPRSELGRRGMKWGDQDLDEAKQ